MRITFVIGLLGNGGAERVLSILASQLSNRNHDVSIVMVYGDRVDYEVDPKVKLIPLNCNGKTSVQRALNRIGQLRRTLKNQQADVIVSLLSDVNLYSVISSLGMKKRLVLCDRNDPNHDPNTPLKRKIRNFFYRFAHGFVFQTEDAKSYYRKIIQKKPYTVIPNPIKENLPEYHTATVSKTIITACRLTQQKNIPMLLEAFAQVHKADPAVTLEIYGEGPLKTQMEAYADKLGLTDSVTFAGYTSNIHKIMQTAAAFTLSSDYEGISNAMLEALAIGIPVAVTDCPAGGARMFVENHINGLLVPVGDSMALGRALTFLVHHREEAVAMGQKAQSIRSRLATSRIVDSWEEFLKSIQK